jgi:hypothetical protein
VDTVELKQDIIRYGIKYGLTSRFTSFLAVDDNRPVGVANDVFGAASVIPRKLGASGNLPLDQQLPLSPLNQNSPPSPPGVLPYAPGTPPRTYKTLTIPLFSPIHLRLLSSTTAAKGMLLNTETHIFLSYSRSNALHSTQLTNHTRQRRSSPHSFPSSAFSV